MKPAIPYYCYARPLAPSRVASLTPHFNLEKIKIKNQKLILRMPTAPQEVLIFPSPSLRLRGALGSTTPNAQNSTFANPMKKSGCNRRSTKLKELFFSQRTRAFL